ncbi:MAG: branched-chain amino acid ABC transporter permease [Hyphomicrobiales bacterium]|nr:branched-chain amino acid ABC transporter permease [Hyphomicrobiales bacterium]
MFAQQLLNGVLSGAVYALFALGFTLMFGVLGVINLTYGLYFSAGAFVALFATHYAHLPIWAALPLAALIVGLCAILLDELLLGPLRRAKAPELSSLMVTLGATLLLYSLMTAWFGTEIRRFPPAVFSGAAYDVFGLRITLAQILIVLTTALIVGGLAFLLQKTRLGLSIRALAENPDAAQLMGVNASGVVHLVSFISGALGAAAGVLIGLNYNAIEPYMGEKMMLKGFAVIILGGLGDIRGAVLAGFLLGLLETFTAGYVASSMKDAVGFLLLVLTLWFRPSGLFGRAAVKRA